MSEQRTDGALDPLRLLTIPDAAKVLGVHEEFVRDLIAKREIGAVLRGREWRIPRRSLEVWAERIAQECLLIQPAPVRRRGRPPKNRAA